jgi:hypothetical protein
LGFERGGTLFGWVGEEEGASAGGQLAEPIHEEGRSGGAEEISILLGGRGWEISLKNGNMNAVGRNNGHWSVGELSLKRATEVMVCPDNCGAGEDGRIEIIVCGVRRTGSVGRRMRKIGEAKLFRHGVCDIDIGRLAGLKVVVHGLDDGAEDAVVSRQRHRLVGRAGVRECLCDNFDGVSSWIGIANDDTVAELVQTEIGLVGLDVAYLSR